MNKMKLFVQAMNEKVDLMVDILKEKTQTDEKIDVYGVFQSLTLDIICQSVLALKSNCQRDPDDLLLVSVRGFLTNAANGAVKLAIYFPFVGRMMAFISNYITYSGRMTANVVSHIKKVLKIRRNMSFEGTPDVVQLMIEAAEMTGDENQTKAVMTDNEIIANCWVFLLAGFETTAGAITFTAYLLAKHPEIQDKLHDE